MQVITFGKRLVPIEQIAFIEVFDPASNPEFKPERDFKGRVVLLNRDTVLTEMTPHDFAAAHNMRLAAELRRYLEKEAATVPASDRVVTLDHNSPKYRAATDALETLEDAITETNDDPDAEDKEQKISEISAARRLLQAVRVRVAAIGTLLATSLLYLATTFVNTGIGQAAKFAWEQIVALLGPLIH
jgi:hypothetical protein